MFTDPEHLRTHGRTLQHVADTLDDAAATLHRGGDVEWVSTAAATFRQVLAQRAADVTDAAGAARDASSSMDELAEAVALAQARIRQAQRLVVDLVAEAQATIDALAAQMSDGGRQALPEVVARHTQALWVLELGRRDPPPDSPEWLELARAMASVAPS